MNTAEIITLIFRISALIIGLLMAFFGYKIYKHSRGATKGYLYMAVFGIALFFWSSTATLFRELGMFTPRIITGTIFLAAISVFLLLSYTKLVIDFNISKPKWLNERFTIGFLIAGYLFFIILNFVFIKDASGYEHIMRKILSISHVMLSISAIYALIPLYYLMSATKKAPWIFAFVFILTVAIGLNVGAYFDGCCGKNGELGSEPLCSEYDLDYLLVYELPCLPGIVSFGSKYQLMLLLGLIFGDISFYPLWRKLS